MKSTLNSAFVLVACLGGVLTGYSGRAALAFTSLVYFNGANGSVPVSSLIQDDDGVLYGTTAQGGQNNGGTIFKVGPDGFSVLYFFTGGSHGAIPSGGLTKGLDGAFYGTTYSGGDSNCGTVFRMTPDGILTTLVSFSVTNGANPDVAMVLRDDRSFYGTTKYGGPYTNTTSGGNGYGVVFQVTTNGSLTVPVPLANTNGTDPTVIICGNDGNFYGTTAWGGDTAALTLGFGTIFQLAPDGTYTNIYLFSGGDDGGFPYGGLVQGKDGNFYGTTFNGGAYGYGTIYRIAPNGGFTLLYTFTGGLDGAMPYAGLMLGSDGNLYGTTYSRGVYGYGTIFRFVPDGVLEPLLSFTGISGNYPGSSPRARLLQGRDGNLYGTTLGGGFYNGGTVFRVSVPMAPAIRSFVQTNGTVQFAWSAVAGQTYQVLYTSNLGALNWTNLGDSFVATNGTVVTTDSAGTATQRYYRVALLP